MNLSDWEQPIQVKRFTQIMVSSTQQQYWNYLDELHLPEDMTDIKSDSKQVTVSAFSTSNTHTHSSRMKSVSVMFSLTPHWGMYLRAYSGIIEYKLDKAAQHVYVCQYHPIKQRKKRTNKSAVYNAL